MSLYRTYRPKTFADVAGQRHIVTTLEEAVKQGKLSHAYLFAGTRGTGKTSIARILAKEMLTRGMDDSKLMEQIKTAVDEGNLVDLMEIDAASNRGIDDIRNLLEKIQFSPVVGKAKVYIIDEVHMLTREAFNALLKTLEEPPPYAFFILATTELHKIPLTIQSRCQRFLFRALSEEDIIARLTFIAEQEKIEVDAAAFLAIAHHVQGGLRDAISLLDQLRSLPAITSEDVKQRIGESGHEYVEQTLAALAQGDREQLLSVVKRLEEAGIPLEHFLRLLLTSIRRDLHAAIEQKQPTERLLTVLNALLDAIKDVRIAPVPGLVVEAALLSLVSASAEHVPAVPSITPPPVPSAPHASEKSTSVEKAKTVQHMESASPAPAAELSLSAVQEAWTSIQQHIESPAAKMSLKNGRLVALQGSTLTLSFGSAFHRDKAADLVIARALETALEKHFGKAVRLRYALETDLEPKAAATPEVVNLADAAGEVF